jgi:hypothetical protein
MALKLACPRCHEVAFFDDDWAGKAVTCGKCAQVFRVPRASGDDAAQAPALPPAQVAPLEARPMPLSFAPAEPLHTHAVPLSDERVPARFEPLFNDLETPNGKKPRPRPEPDEGEASRPRRRAAPPVSPKVPWVLGVSSVAFLLMLFVVTALWFMMKDHRRPPQPQPPWVRGNPPPGPFIQVQPGGPGWPQRVPQGPVIPLAQEQPIEIKLKNGEFKEKGVLAPNDVLDIDNHPDRQGMCHRKVYLVELEANRNYVIEMNMHPPQRGPFRDIGQIRLDPWLRIEDPQGNKLFEHDDIVRGVELNARIQARFPAKATYRIIATTCDGAQTGEFFLIIRDEDRGKPVTPKQLAKLDLPKAAQAKEPLKTSLQDRRQTQITHIELGGDPLVGDVHWSKDARAAFVLDSKGLLRRIRVPGFVEEKRLDLGQPPSNLALCSEGLVVGLEKLQEAWVIDPDSLQVRGRISAPGVQHLTAAPALPLVFASVRLPGQQFPGIGVMVLDAAKGVPIRQYDYPLKHVTATPDGKFLFGEGGIERLLRYRIQGDELLPDDESAQIASKGQGIVVSSDSLYVCLPSATGNYTGAVKPPAKPFSTYVYGVNNLREPAFIVHSGAAPRTLGFDRQAELVFGHNQEKELIVFTAKGDKIEEYNLPGGGRLVTEPRQFLAHPDGRKLLIRAERDLYWVELPKE